MSRRGYITVDVSEDVDIDDIIDKIDDNDLMDEVRERGLITKRNGFDEITDKKLKEIICDRYGLNHLTSWKDLINSLQSEML